MALVLTDVRDGVATLTLNNPDERNTLTAAMVTEIIAAMDEAEREGQGAIRLDGRLVDAAHAKTARQQLDRARRLWIG